MQRQTLTFEVSSYCLFNPCNAEIHLCKQWRLKGFFSIWNHHKWHIGNSFCFIWIPLQKAFVLQFFQEPTGIDFRPQNLKSSDVRFCRQMTVFALKELVFFSIWNHHKWHIVNSFCFIWIPMLWVYRKHWCFNSFRSLQGSILDRRILNLQTSDFAVKWRFSRWKG